MLSAVEGVLFSVAATEAVLGILGNTFIALVNCMEWAKNKRLSMADFLLTGLATSRIFIIWVITIDAYTKLFYPTMHVSRRLSESITYMWMTVNHLTVWFATSLSIFYCLKIANFSHYAFRWLKRRTDKVFVFLIGCLLITWLITFSLVVKVMKDDKIKYGNRTWKTYWKKREFTSNYILVNIGVISLFAMTLAACFLLIISLWRHRRQMQSHVSEFRDLNTAAHVKAMKVMISFIILFILYFIGISIEIICLFIPENKLLFIFGLTTASMYPSWHAFIQILTNSQLKQAFVRVLRGLKFSGEGRPNLREL